MTDDSIGQKVPADDSQEPAPRNQAKIEIPVPPRAQVETPLPSQNASQTPATPQPEPSAREQSDGDPRVSAVNEPFNGALNKAQSVNAFVASQEASSSPKEPEPVNFVAFGEQNTAFEGDGDVSASSALIADAHSGKPDIDFAGTISNKDAAKDEEEIEKGLAQVDPLTVHPRVSSCILAVVLALICFASAAGIYWFGVHTLEGQSFDEIVWQSFNTSAPGWIIAVSHVLNRGVVIVVVSLAIAVVAFIIAAVRKRWWLVGQMAVFGVVTYGAAWLKRLLPRPMIMRVMSTHENSAPSGHTLLAVGSVLVLLVAVPRVWRALVALLGSAYSILVAASVIVGRWHRPSDVLMSLLIGGGLMLLALAFTRKSGMDSPGSRMSSASIQIVGSIMITFGVVSCAYAGYMLWQIYPGLDMMAAWAKNGACALTMAAILGVGCLMFGLALAVRQLTASPLTRLGLVGAPPAPPQE
ncbi:phosphatase PAP2 family protein [Bifidobacterium sp. ESL0784]|uniref:phosphatase PAP2 family protein n=1 Tax=Bifidobacterium sp. ESL0784 TaxID=2983231 RepID=UPI0023F71A3A|nr:phosphatase PAP2 family protein [Bifidobacterium sp. ESL0784]MDF7640697.1 phosphatase PAP2 family protein [Bifidobacterium sp. ESL0784]